MASKTETEIVVVDFFVFHKKAHAPNSQRSVLLLQHPGCRRAGTVSRWRQKVLLTRRTTERKSSHHGDDHSSNDDKGAIIIIIIT